MIPNKRTVDAYMDAFRRSDREAVLACLTDDVEWLIPGAFHTHGKEEFGTHIVDEGFEPNPEITIFRTVEEGDVVVAEGTAGGKRTTGEPFKVVFCDIFEMKGAKIRRLTSYLMAADGP